MGELNLRREKRQDNKYTVSYVSNNKLGDVSKNIKERIWWSGGNAKPYD